VSSSSFIEASFSILPVSQADLKAGRFENVSVEHLFD
jgi:hypothetical protein